LYRRRLAGIGNVCRQDGGDTAQPQAVKFLQIQVLYCSLFSIEIKI
jgi:hypothetical protein